MTPNYPKIKWKLHHSLLIRISDQPNLTCLNGELEIENDEWWNADAYEREREREYGEE